MLVLVRLTFTRPLLVLTLVIVSVTGCLAPLYSNEPFQTNAGANTSAGTVIENTYAVKHRGN